MDSNDLLGLLTEVSFDQYNDELPECRLFAAIVVSGINDREYLNSDVFWWHCKQLRLNPSFVLKVLNGFKGNAIAK